MAKIKHGIIGTGGMARNHAEQFRAIRGVELHGCYDVASEKADEFVENLGFKHAMPSVDALLDACDSVSIVTPDAFHAGLSLQTLKAGRHLLCEKPLTTTLADARKVARAAQTAAEKHDAIHMVNFSYRDSAAFQKAVKLVADGRLGQIRHVSGKYLQAWLASNVWGNSGKDGWMWRQRIPAGGGKASGGTLGDIGCHILDFASAIAGDIKSLRCSVRNYPKIKDGTDEFVTTFKGHKLDANDSVLIEFELAEHGGIGSIEATRWAIGHPNQVALAVYGTKGALEIDLEDSNTKIRTCMGKDRHTCDWTVHELKPTPNNYQRFIRSIRSGNNDQADVVRGAQVQAYLDACERSAEDDGKATKIRKWV